MKANTDLHTIALTFLERHHAEHLSHDRRHLIERCITHLMEVQELSASTAEDIALQAIGERESRDRREYIDLDRTTSYVVFLRDPLTGRKRVFTAADLMMLVCTPALASQPVPSSRDLLAGREPFTC